MSAPGSLVHFLRRRDYVFVRVLGQGACGQTVLLRDEVIDGHFVCKKYVPFSESHRQELFKNFLREIKLLHEVHHQNVVRVFNYYMSVNTDALRRPRAPGASRRLPSRLERARSPDMLVPQNPGMSSRTPKTFVVDLSHFLTDHGAMAPMPGPARRLAAYMARIVADATGFLVNHGGGEGVKCRCRPGRKPCSGVIETDFELETDRIVWWCPECGENGFIDTWKGTLWDRTADRTRH